MQDNDNIKTGNRFYEKVLGAFLSPSRKIPGFFLKLVCGRLLRHPSQFIVHYHPVTRHCIACVTDSAMVPPLSCLREDGTDACSWIGEWS
jgi:hypothetical protein